LLGAEIWGEGERACYLNGLAMALPVGNRSPSRFVASSKKFHASLLRFAVWNRNMLICTASHRFFRRFALCQLGVMLLLSALLIPAMAAEAPRLDPLTQAQTALDQIEIRGGVRS